MWSSLRAPGVERPPALLRLLRRNAGSEGRSVRARPQEGPLALAALVVAALRGGGGVAVGDHGGAVEAAAAVVAYVLERGLNASKAGLYRPRACRPYPKIPKYQIQHLKRYYCGTVKHKT